MLIILKYYTSKNYFKLEILVKLAKFTKIPLNFKIKNNNPKISIIPNQNLMKLQKKIVNFGPGLHPKKTKYDSSLRQDCEHFSTIKCTNKVYMVCCTHS